MHITPAPGHTAAATPAADIARPIGTLPGRTIPLGGSRTIHALPGYYGNDRGYASLADALNALSELTSGDSNAAAAIVAVDGRYFGQRVEVRGERMVPPWLGTPDGGTMQPYREPFRFERSVGMPVLNSIDPSVRALVDGSRIVRHDDV